MALNVSLHRRAEDDLSAILNYITQQADHRTERVRSDIARRLRILSRTPLIGVPSGQPGVRILQPTRYPYRIYYTVQGDHRDPAYSSYVTSGAWRPLTGTSRRPP